MRSVAPRSRVRAMSRSRRVASATVVALTVFTGVLGAPSVAHAAPGVRYVSPTGGGSACTVKHPCEFIAALNGASAGDSVILEPGTYPGPGASYPQTITDGAAS